MNRGGPPQQVQQVLAEARAVAERERPAEMMNQEGQSHDTSAGKAGAPATPSPGAAGQQDRREPLSPAGAPPVGECRSCKAPVYWCVSGTGTRIPVDVEVRENGNIQLHWNGERILAVHLGGNAAAHPGPKRWPHHATCPDGKSWRRR